MIRSRRLSTVKPRRIRWLVPGLMPLRTLTLVAGEGGLGKSLWLALKTAELTRGELGEYGPSDVLLITNEDMADDVIVPRLIAAGADRDRVHELYVQTDEGGAIALDDHLSEIADLVADTAARMIWIDPIGGEAQGFSDKTLDRAATRLGVTREQRGFPARSWWSL